MNQGLKNVEAEDAKLCSLMGANSLAVMDEQSREPYLSNAVRGAPVVLNFGIATISMEGVTEVPGKNFFEQHGNERRRLLQKGKRPMEGHTLVPCCENQPSKRQCSGVSVGFLPMYEASVGTDSYTVDLIEMMRSHVPALLEPVDHLTVVGADTSSPPVHSTDAFAYPDRVPHNVEAAVHGRCSSVTVAESCDPCLHMPPTVQQPSSFLSHFRTSVVSTKAANEVAQPQLRSCSSANQPSAVVLDFGTATVSTQDATEVPGRVSYEGYGNECFDGLGSRIHTRYTTRQKGKRVMEGQPSAAYCDNQSPKRRCSAASVDMRARRFMPMYEADVGTQSHGHANTGTLPDDPTELVGSVAPVTLQLDGDPTVLDADTSYAQVRPSVAFGYQYC